MPVKRHQQQVIRNSARSPRRVSRDQLEVEKQDAAVSADLEERRAEAVRNHKPAIMTRQGLIDAGLLIPRKRGNR